MNGRRGSLAPHRRQSPPARRGASHAVAAAVACALLLPLASCRRAPRVLGESVGSSPPVTIAEIREDPDRFAGREVVLEGTMAAVCPTSGCFFDLVDGTGHLTVDLEGGRHFTVPLDCGGRPARVRAVVVREGDAPLHAIGRGVELP